jgi:hypothetical protein
MAIDEVWMINGFIDLLDVVTTNNYTIIAIFGLYSSLEHII